MPSAALELVQGLDGSFPLQITTDGVTPSTAYLNSDELSGRLSIGEDQPTLFAPGVSWIDATVAKYQIVIAGAQSATLTPGTYYVQAIATRGSLNTLISPPKLAIEILPAPGTAAALKSYCTYRDMLRFAPWVARLQGQVDLAGFAQERQDARDWFEDLLYRHYRGGQGVAADYFFIPGISFGARWWGNGPNVFRSGARSAALQGWLDADGLLITSEVIKANAAYAIAQVAKGQIVPGNDKSNVYAGFYAHFESLAENTASLITAELDTDADGITDTVIRLGVADTLEG